MNHPLSTIAADVKFGLRMLRKSPAFTAIAVLTLALGIGANTAIFSVINSVVLRPLPLREPDHVFHVWGNFAGIGLPNNQNAISPPELRDLESQSRCFSHVAGVRPGASFNLALGDIPQRVEGAQVTPSFFPLLGVPPALGRGLLPADAESQSQVVVLSHGLWKRGFASDAGVIGRRVNLNGVSHEVVGVMPAGYEMFDAELWVPLAFSTDQLKSRGDHWLLVLARVKAEFTLDQAQADLRLVTQSVKEQNPNYPYARHNFAFRMTPLQERMVGDVKKPLWILAGAVALVLLIACANVAGLLLVRSSAREREVAIRMALGAGRGRLFLQWLTESVLLSALGGLAGLAIAQGGLKLLIYFGSAVFPRIAEATLDGQVLVFTTVISVVTGVLFGLAPGLHIARDVKAKSLRGSGLGLTASPISQRLRHSLIVVEMALSLVILTGAGLLVRSLVQLWSVDGGFRAENVLTTRVSLPESKYGDTHRAQAFYHEVLERIAHLAGVEAVGGATVLPLSGGGSSGTVVMESTALPPDRTSPETDKCVVTPGYFEAMGITLLSGRTFDDQDTDQSQPVAIVDETLARTYWPNEDAVGKRLRLPGKKAPWATIVGVVRHVRTQSLETPSRIQVYWPETQITHRSLTLVIRTGVAPMSLAASVQKEIAAVDPEQPAYRIKTMKEWMQDSLALRRMGTWLLAAFAGVALLLAAVGMYGVMAYWVNQRTHEFGLRMALGAGRRDVLRLVTGQGLRLALIGIGLGVAGAFVLTRVLSSMLFNVSSADPITFMGVSLALMGAMLLACYVPARRAARVEPMKALRTE
jgi:putative ABC transport system permease protein